MAVPQIEAEKIGVGGRISWCLRWLRTPRTSGWVGLAHGAAPGTLAVEPIADRAAGQLKIATDITKRNAGGSQLKGTLAEMRGMHIGII